MSNNIMRGLWGRRIKRLFDLSASAVGLAVLSPVLAAVALAVRVKLGRPVFFRQVRPGFEGQPFTMLKFRTMVDARGSDGELLPDAERFTPFGRALRHSSLDELPQLWNVVRGDMSLVGPRPLFMHYLPYYSEREHKRHNVRPGITGLSQVSGRNMLTWEERLEMDVKYAENVSFVLDVEILVKTVLKVIKKSDVLEAAPQGSLSSYRDKTRKVDVA